MADKIVDRKINSCVSDHIGVDAGNGRKDKTFQTGRGKKFIEKIICESLPYFKVKTSLARSYGKIYRFIISVLI